MCLGSKWRLYGLEPTGRLDPPIVPCTPLRRCSLQGGPAHLWEGPPYMVALHTLGKMLPTGWPCTPLGWRFLMLGFSLLCMLSST